MDKTPDIITLAHAIEQLADSSIDFNTKANTIQALVILEIITVREAIDLTLEYLTE